MNPVEGVEDGLPKQRDKVMHYTALPYAELPDLMREMEALEGMGALALRFLILTAGRSGEVRGATWPEIDVDARMWVISAERMKAGAEHKVPISDAALAVLDAARGYDPNLLFPGQRRGRPMTDATIAMPLKRLKIQATVHGFRSAFRDWAAERTNVPREIAELSLAHEVGSAVERSYRRSDLFEKRQQLMDQWGRFCMSAGSVGEVVELRR
jgi:integrase